MTVRERILAIKLLEKTEQCPTYLEKLHLTAGIKENIHKHQGE